MQPNLKDVTNETPEPPTKAKTPRRPNQSGIVAPRDPLPDRPGRNIHPAGLVATCRTLQEVAAQRSAKRQAAKETVREGERAKELLAQMNVDEERHDEQMLTDNLQHLSAALRRKQGRECLSKDSSNGKEFDLDAVEGDSDSDDTTVEPVKGKAVSCTMSIGMWTDHTCCPR